MSTTLMTFAERAAITTQYGVPVMPLRPRTKIAFLDEWPTRATTDAKQIEEWQKKNSDFNCAAVARSGGFWILDIDDPALAGRITNETGHSLEDLDTLVVKSSGAKRHFYFKHDERSEAMGYVDAHDSKKEIFSARCHNAYVVSAGSVHPDTGEPYEIMAVPAIGEIPTAPLWLIDWILKFKPKSQGQTSAAAACDTVGEAGAITISSTQPASCAIYVYPKKMCLRPCKI